MRNDDLPTTKKALEEDVELARAAARRRLAAPPVNVGGPVKLKRKELIELYAPECVDHIERVGKRIRKTLGEAHPIWVEKKTYRDWIAKGYEPVVHEGSFVDDEGDVLLKCPQELHTKALEEPAARAAWRAKAPGEDMKAVPGASQETMKSVSVEEGEAAASDGT